MSCKIIFRCRFWAGGTFGVSWCAWCSTKDSSWLAWPDLITRRSNFYSIHFPTWNNELSSLSCPLLKMNSWSIFRTINPVITCKSRSLMISISKKIYFTISRWVVYGFWWFLFSVRNCCHFRILVSSKFFWRICMRSRVKKRVLFCHPQITQSLKSLKDHKNFSS